MDLLARFRAYAKARRLPYQDVEYIENLLREAAAHGLERKAEDPLSEAVLLSGMRVPVMRKAR